MWTFLLLAACTGPRVDLADASTARAPFVVEAELTALENGKAVLGDELAVRLAIKRPDESLAVGRRYRARVEKRRSGLEVTCLEDAPYRCGEGARSTPVHELGEAGVVDGLLRSKVVCPRCPPDGKCEPCVAKVVLDSGHTIYLQGVDAVPELGTRVRLAVRRVKAGPQGFPGIEATCVEPAAR